MKVIILAAGYAKRLYPLTLNRAKPLLSVAGRPIIDYIVDGVSSLSGVDKIFVVTNDKFYGEFRDWRNVHAFDDKIEILNDGTKSESDKLGAIGDIHFVISEKGIDEDLVVVAGDNMFGFELKKFSDFFLKKGLSIASYKYPHKNELSQYGIVELDKGCKVIGFQEKPEKPKSDLVAVCLYGFPKNKLAIISEYMDNNGNNDAPGYYIEWLAKREAVCSFVFTESWHDIGTPEAYKRAEEEYKELSLTTKKRR